MGKRKDVLEDAGKSDLCRKKQKRHSHKKHKKRKKPESEEIDSDESIDVSFDDSHDSKIKVKIKTEKVASAADILRSQKRSERKTPPTSVVAESPKAKRRRGGRGKESGTSSEEERWLDAIESGKLEEVDDELKKIKPKDPKMMTARQRAMYERGTDKEACPGSEVLLALPSGYKEKVMTAEAIQKAAIKSLKRKQLADEKREKDKKKTMERLLKKQDSKSTKGNVKTKCFRQQVPLVSYKNGVDLITLSVPHNVDFPMKPQYSIDPPKPVICGAPDCTNLKKYSCSRTRVPLCSLECYKRNLVSIFM